MRPFNATKALSGCTAVPDRAAERFNVSVDVIRAHYDPRDKSRRKDDRADAVRNAWDDI